MKLDKNMVAALLAFGGGKGGGIVPSGTLSISANGTYDVGAFASAVVAVPASAVCSGTKSISENGTHDVVGFANVDVNVSGGGQEDAIIERTLSGLYTNNNVGKIGSYAFALCPLIQFVTFNNATSIGTNGFGQCTSLISASFAECKSVGAYAFDGCTSLESLSLPKCEYVGSHAFRSCSALSFINLPECLELDSLALADWSGSQVSLPKVSLIGNGAFFYTKIETLELPGVLTAPAGSAFYSASMLKSLYLPNMTTIGTGRFGSALFGYCYSLTYISLPNLKYWNGDSTWSSRAWNTVGQLPYLRLPKLESLYYGYVFGSNTYIKSVIFDACSLFSGNTIRYATHISAIYLFSTAVCTLKTSGAFNSTISSFYVPDNLYSDYLSATNWVYYSSKMISMTSAEIETAKNTFV